ncbi:hypothetical protein CERSUDRAFT_98692 [Gelatoporia subvermispora B]|uniref:Reverse transcriptase domain-containing protein n=1 Tax=Ceriporiopsis subvermispora (strain B) TaxID=914234 RepID=M2PBU7_CERS8|nr:hypothetical protein CERSUDRAFT_98692 [Gelatoporia subvermispora B]
MSRASAGTSAPVPQMPGPAVTDMPAPIASRVPTPLGHARTGRIDPGESIQDRRPRYARGLLWSNMGPDIFTVADSTLCHPPLPDVPETERSDPVVNATLRQYPHLFHIVTPINIDRFDELLRDHPNRPFVKSVVRGLREGFWPWAERPEEYPVTWDEVRPEPTDEAVAAFLETQRQEELAAGRFSEAFGLDLLPGMYCMPVHAVPKPHSDKMRLVTNHSAGAYSLNSMIPREAIAGVVLDGIPALGQALRRIRREHQRSLVMWKSDVSHAYRLMPMSPFWQIKQIVTIGGKRHVDHCNVFGNRGSQRIWNAFISLVIWIVIQMHLITLLGYVDDNYGAEEEGQLEYYKPYGYYYPRAQVLLLQIWDELGIPHEFKKQIYGPIIPIIGFDVDPNTMTVSMTSESKAALLKAIEKFCDTTTGRCRHTLREFLSLAGYVNWSLNVYPLLKPALSSLYAKTAGKDKMNASIHVNQSIVNELEWFSHHVEISSGVHFFGAEEWATSDLTQTDVSHEIAYVDASGSGLGIYFPWLGCGYTSSIPSGVPPGVIFFTEALTACVALHKVRDFN